jgi:hypothetical protein
MRILPSGDLRIVTKISCFAMENDNLVGGFNHLEKYESQWAGLSQILWKIKHVPNHQPAMFNMQNHLWMCHCR